MTDWQQSQITALTAEVTELQKLHQAHLEKIAELKGENAEFRKTLWVLNPDFSTKAYGDDGEMQIAPYDYKRDSADRVIEATTKALQSSLAAKEQEIERLKGKNAELQRQADELGADFHESQEIIEKLEADNEERLAAKDKQLREAVELRQNISDLAAIECLACRIRELLQARQRPEPDHRSK